MCEHNQAQTIDDDKRRRFIAGALVAMAAVPAAGCASAATSPAAVSTGMLKPVRLDRSHLEGKGLEPLQPWPAKMMLRPVASHRLVQWFTGTKLTAMVYDADDGLLQFTDLPYDEHVVLLNGTATLTSPDGTREVFKKGDVFVVPKGWTGTWELRDSYRELICFESSSVEYAMKLWF